MEEKKFRSISIRDPLVKKIEEFIETCPEFIRDNPEYNSVAGFFDQAARQKLQQLKDNGIKKLPNLEGV